MPHSGPVGLYYTVWFDMCYSLNVCLNRTDDEMPVADGGNKLNMIREGKIIKNHEFLLLPAHSEVVAGREWHVWDGEVINSRPQNISSCRRALGEESDVDNGARGGCGILPSPNKRRRKKPANITSSHEKPIRGRARSPQRWQRLSAENRNFLAPRCYCCRGRGGCEPGIQS